MTKPVVAVGVLRLVEEGRVGLDDPVARYIPAFADVQVFAGGTAAEPCWRSRRRRSPCGSS
jgi:CubicO group peptidase (beta-lactamase class C family)